MKNENLFYRIAGASVAAISVALITDYSVRAGKKKDTSIVSLLAGIAGLAAGMAIASKPERDAVRRLQVEDMIDEEDADLMGRNISEVLGVAADRGTVSRDHLHRIEVDEETSIEDFIFDA